MVFDVIALVFALRVILLAFDRLTFATCASERAAACLVGAYRRIEREQLFHIGRAAHRAVGNFPDLHDLVEVVAARAAFEVIERHGLKSIRKRRGSQMAGLQPSPATDEGAVPMSGETCFARYSRSGGKSRRRRRSRAYERSTSRNAGPHRARSQSPRIWRNGAAWARAFPTVVGK